MRSIDLDRLDLSLTLDGSPLFNLRRWPDNVTGPSIAIAGNDGKGSHATFSPGIAGREPEEHDQ